MMFFTGRPLIIMIHNESHSYEHGYDHGGVCRKLPKAIPDQLKANSSGLLLCKRQQIESSYSFMTWRHIQFNWI